MEILKGVALVMTLVLFVDFTLQVSRDKAKNKEAAEIGGLIEWKL
ncbi:hypothetical protein R9X47_09570 [Wukongibacter baidiensis]